MKSAGSEMKKIIFLFTGLWIFSSCFPGGEYEEEPVFPDESPSFSSTDGDGLAELGYAPTPASTTEAGTEVSPLFSVDSDTGFVKIFLAQENDQTPNIISGNKALVSGAGYYTLTFGIPTNLSPGNYQVGVDVATGSADYNDGAGTFTRYIQSSTGSNYWQYFFNNGTVINSFESDVTATLITVTSPALITPQATTCGDTAETAVSISASSAPSAFTSTTVSGGACYYKLTMANGGLNFYSISLDSMTADHLLTVFSTSGFFLPSQCLTTLTGASWYNCSMVQSDLDDILYIWVGNLSGPGGSFRLVTP
jgi:hypothetical protein